MTPAYLLPPTCLAVITGLVLMRASSSHVWKEWELRGAVFLSLALQIVLICLGKRRKYLPQAWIRVVTWSAYLLADSVATYAIGMISRKIWEIKAGKSLSNPHTELSTFWSPFLLLHLGGPDTISGYAIEDNDLWLRHLLPLVKQTGLTVYVLVVAWTHPTFSFLAILILLLGFYKYGERVWVLRAASNEYFKESLNKSQRHYSDKIMEECELKWEEGYDVVLHHVIDVENEDAIMMDDAIAEFSSKKPSSWQDLEDQKCIASTLLSGSHLVDTSQRLFAEHLFSMKDRDSRLLILSGKYRAGDFKVIEIELSFIYDALYSKAKAIYTKWGFICRLAILFLIGVALVLFSLTNKRSYSKPDLFLTFLLLGAAIFGELYALVHILFSDQVACWLIKNKQFAIFYFINRIKPPLERPRWFNSMGQYNLMSLKVNDSCWLRFLKLLDVDEMAMKFLYQGLTPVTVEIKSLILSKIKEMEPRDARELLFPMMDRGFHALRTHKLLDQLQWSMELDFDMSILVWHIATELCYYLDFAWSDSTKELERNNQSPVKEKSLMGLHLSRYMLYLQFMCPSMLPARTAGIRFRDIYKEPNKHFDLPKFSKDRPACGCNRRERKPDILEESEVAYVRKKFLDKLFDLAYSSVSKEDQVGSMLRDGCRVALELRRVPLGWKWTAISDVWVEMLIFVAYKCKARDHARQMQQGGELITHVWLLMGHYGLTDHFQISRSPAGTAEMIVNPW